MVIRGIDQYHQHAIDLENELDVLKAPSESVNVIVIPHKGNHKIWTQGRKWGDDLMLENVMRNIGTQYKITPSYDFENNDFEGADIVHLCNLSHTALRRRRLRGWESRIKKLTAESDRPLFIGGIRGDQGFNKAKKFIKYFDAIQVSNKSLLRRVAEYNPNVFLLYPGVDLDEFSPMHELRPRHFTIGWAGDDKKTMKNFHLLPKLEFSYKVATKFNYVLNYEMPFFYNSLSTYVYFSDHEGCNRTILEAAACGLPIVSTDAGAVRELLDPEWIIEGDPEKSVSEFSDKVQILKEDYELRQKVGQKNRERVHRWSWERITRDLEEIWDNLLGGI